MSLTTSSVFSRNADFVSAVPSCRLSETTPEAKNLRCSPNCLYGTDKRFLEIVESLLQICFEGVVERLLLFDRLGQVRIDSVEVLVKLCLEVANLIDRKIIDVAVGSSED